MFNAKRYLILLFSLCSTLVFSQLTVSYVSADQAVQALLGPGASYSNAIFNGVSQQLGQMSGNTDPNFQITEGIVIGCSDAQEVVPNFLGTIVTPNVSGDPDLLAVANSVPPLIGQDFTVGSVNNIASLEFDFVAQGNSLNFSYIFGSDEYLTFVNSQYNDVFAFFLSGPGITGSYSAPGAFPGGSVNIAILPQSTPPLPITISSVNNVLNAPYYVDNSTNTIPINLNGFTVKLAAQHDLLCGETYHIRMAIANGSDQALKSAVILEVGSFNLSSTIELFFVDTDYDGYAGDSLVYSCSQLPNYYLTSTDCNDSNPTIHPGALEVFSNSIDENCDGIIACEVAFTNQPTDVFAPIGGMANFTLNISSANSGVSYQWQTLFNGQWINLFNAGQYAGVNTSSLAVNNLNQNNYGKWFRCYLTSAQNAFCPTYSDSATILGCDSFQQNFEISASQDTVCIGGQVLMQITGIAESSTFQNNTALYVPDNLGCIQTNLTFTEFANATISSINDIESISANIEHSFASDIIINIICPQGNTLQLFNGMNGGGIFLGEPIDVEDPNQIGVGYDYTWDPFSPVTFGTAISGVTGTLPAGTYNADGDWSALVGCTLNGTWQFQICDQVGADDGWLFNWRINFNSVSTAAIDSITWQGNTLNWDDGNGNAYFSPDQYGPNEYSVLATLSNGCVLSDTISIEAVGPIISLVPEINTCALPVNLNPIVQGGADYVQWSYYYNPTVLSQYNTLNTSILQQPSSNTYMLSVASYANGLYCTDSAYVVVNFVDASILLQPNSVEANLGDIVYFSCIASPGATYQWQILANGVWTNLFNAGQFSGVNTSQLSVSNVNLNNVNQQFQCIISSADGGCTDTSNTVSINFCDIASSSIPSVLNISLNSSPNIGITPVTNGATYQWQSNVGFGWMNISDGSNYSGTSTPNLQILTADWQNENEWLQCVVTTNLCSDTTNICVVHITPMGIDETEAGSIYYYENAIHFSKISAALGQPYYVFDGSGKLISEGVYFGDQTIHLDLASSGVYCFKLGDRIIKFVKVN